MRVATSPASASHQEPEPAEGPIDLAHLARATFGDPGLEREVLALFEAQSMHLLAQIATPEVDIPSRAALAHKLKGSASGIGAWSVAEAAAAVETALSHAGAAPHLDIARLAAAVEDAQDFIRQRIASPARAD